MHAAEQSRRIHGGGTTTREALPDQSLLEEPECVALQARNVHLRDSEPLGDLGLREAEDPQFEKLGDRIDLGQTFGRLNGYSPSKSALRA